MLVAVFRELSHQKGRRPDPYTAPNVSDTWRRAIALSYMRATSTSTGDGESPEYFPIKGKTYPGCVR